MRTLARAPPAFLKKSGVANIRVLLEGVSLVEKP
jgi:hypothetical protein